MTLGLVLVAAGVALALLLRAGDGDGDPFDRPGGGGGDGALTLAGITSFDPEGDGEERDDLLAGATDGDQSTAWQSECYSSAAFGNLKDGVGVVVDLGASAGLDAVDVLSPGGWSAEVYVAEEPGATLADWGEPVGGSGGAGDGDTTMELDDADGQFVLVFFTSLGEVAGCEFPFGVTVAELAVR